MGKSKQDLTVYTITDQATFKFDGCGYGYAYDDISYKVEGLQDHEGNPGVLAITVGRNAGKQRHTFYDLTRHDLKHILRHYNIRRMDTGDASDSSSSDSS